MRSLIVAPAKTGSTALEHMLIQAQGNAQIFHEEPASALHNLPENCVAKIVFDNEDPHTITELARQFDRKILVLRDPRDSLLSRVLYSVANAPKLLADDAFMDTLLSSVSAKQAQPQAHDFLDIVRLLQPDLTSFINTRQTQMQNYLNFAATASDWQVVYYEDMVAGNLRGLQRYLGLQLSEAKLRPECEMVARSKTSGNWKHWFTAQDVATLRPIFEAQLLAAGYENDWELAAQPAIAAEHAQGYLLNLIQKRRRHFDLPVYVNVAQRQQQAAANAATTNAAAPTAANVQVCNICGNTDFGPGPNGRRAENGALPCCRRCGALERQRIVRSIFQSFPLGFLDWRRGLQFSPDPGVCAEQFRSYEVSVYGGENSLDIQEIARADGAYDFVSFNHVLEFVPDDLKGFAELTRMLSPRGIMQACFSVPLSRAKSEDFTVPFGPHEAWHLYGLDLPERFQCAAKGLTLLVIDAGDPCTKAREIIHFFLKDKEDVTRIKTWLQVWHPDARIVNDAS